MQTIYKAFPGGKHKVLTMSYDDGREEDVRLISIFRKYGIKGTFHLNSGLYDDPVYRRNPKEQIRDLYEGMEISCHTYTHPTIARCPSTEMVKQTLKDREELEAIAGYTVRGMSYPNGSYSREVIKAMEVCGIEYSRTVLSTFRFDMPTDFMEWNPTCHHKANGRLLELGQQFLDLHKTQYLYMMYVWGHSYEFGIDNNWDLIEDFCRLMGGKDDIWYATNIEIVDYLKAWDQLKFSADGTFCYNPTALSLWVEVNKKAYEVRPGETLHF
ncbi:MAG: polysaccharide deacetylase family protein [Firmicutes bacterium]|nr:polysaccharide deacetylase family protein [Bacillota bacterium]